MKVRSGFVLIATLWLMIAISVALLGVTMSGREIRLLAVNAGDGVVARQAAHLGIERARLELTDRLTRHSRALSAAELLNDPWRDPDHLLRQARSSDDVAYSLAARDVGTALNLEDATANQLRTLIHAAGIDFALADSIAQAIADWQDVDDAPRPRGAERDDYIHGGLPVLPANASFERMTELRNVRGVSSEVFQRVRPYITLVGSGRININSAERPVLLTLPGIGDEAAAVIVAKRQTAPLTNIAVVRESLSPAARKMLELHIPALASMTTARADEVEVISTGYSGDRRALAVREALFVRNGNEAFITWQRAY